MKISNIGITKYHSSKKLILGHIFRCNASEKEDITKSFELIKHGIPAVNPISEIKECRKTDAVSFGRSASYYDNLWFGINLELEMQADEVGIAEDEPIWLADRYILPLHAKAAEAIKAVLGEPDYDGVCILAVLHFGQLSGKGDLAKPHAHFLFAKRV